MSKRNEDYPTIWTVDFEDVSCLGAIHSFDGFERTCIYGSIFYVQNTIKRLHDIIVSI